MYNVQSAAYVGVCNVFYKYQDINLLCLQYVELDNILINEYLARIAHIILRVINYPYICHLGSLLAEP